MGGRSIPPDDDLEWHQFDGSGRTHFYGDRCPDFHGDHDAEGAPLDGNVPATEIPCRGAGVEQHTYDLREMFLPPKTYINTDQSEIARDLIGRATEQRATSASGGQKGLKPEAYALIPTYPLAELARVYGYGAAKYDDNNWRRGYPYSWSLSALMRHIEAFRSGVSVDSESGRHHLAHAAFHLFTLMHFDVNGTGEDDRADAA